MADLALDTFVKRIGDRSASVAVIGLGYVGLPIVLAFHDAGLTVIGFDIDSAKIEALAAGRSYISHIGSDRIAVLAASSRYAGTTDPARLAQADAIIICVPTPLGPHRDPDLQYVADTARMLAGVLRKGQVVSLESTTYPGTCDEVMIPLLEQSGLKAGADFDVVYSPEREDPANPSFNTRSIPKVIGAQTPQGLQRARALYGVIVDEIVETGDLKTAEAVKITENVFRAVNIALVNELKLIYARMGIDVWDVIDAAKTKPFGFMPFYPGPGLGGHCIPVDPFYLTWRARAFGMHTRFIELSGEINRAMPDHVIAELGLALSRHRAKPYAGSRVLVCGAAYKKNVDDLRESPALELIEKLEVLGVNVDYWDPLIPEIKPTRAHPGLSGRRSVEVTEDYLKSLDAVLLATDHDATDYDLIAANAALIVDTRNAFAGRDVAGVLVKA
ncbi:MAG: nucleotide sugar dehydrogenase [Rhodobiaceae bacterium]|nr:nucleotide sugar dehydrogenase [Rhodobiaceae bacterium]MCC0041448.1 nucleotide sugar dehydrogenase [Rhodobiaceae bacterium]MCC0053802.1 nucleotide sugar dehydrogenase [Rhodobiaceae bacterium]